MGSLANRDLISKLQDHFQPAVRTRPRASVQGIVGAATPRLVQTAICEAYEAQVI